MSDTATITPPTQTSPDVLASMSVEQRGQWRLTGQLPTTPAEAKDSTVEPQAPVTRSDAPADSSPAEPVAQVDATASSTTPASEPGTSKKKANADTRKSELAAEIQALLKQRDDLKAEVRQGAARPSSIPDAPAASSPAPTMPLTLESLVDRPDISRPPIGEAEFFQQFPDATVSDLADYRASYRIQKADAQKVRQSARDSAIEKFHSAIKPSLEADPVGFKAKMDRLPDPISALGPTDKAGPLNYAAEEVFQSSMPAKLIEHLDANPEIIAKMETMKPVEVIRTIAKLEAALDTTSSTPTSPVAKAITSAPSPAVTLGSRPSAPADEVAAAVAAQDFARYASLKNAQEAK